MDKAESIIEEIRNLTSSVQLLALESKNTGEKVENLAEKVEQIEGAPGKKWTTLQTVALTAGVTAIISAIVGAIINLI